MADFFEHGAETLGCIMEIQISISCSRETQYHGADCLVG
jgi:hypothetical protein